MTLPFQFRLNGAVLQPHPSGALFWPEQKTLVVADLHLEKGASIASGGQFLPPYDTIETLNILDTVLEELQPCRLIALGDSFHDPRVAQNLQPEIISRLQKLTINCEMIWVIGNHDPEIPPFLGGTVVQDYSFAPLHFRHEASPLFAQPGEISGHFHPKATTLIKDRRYTRPVFVVDERRLILPAFGVFTGGLWVHTPEIYGLFSKKIQVFFCSKNRVLPVPMAQVLPRVN